MERMQEVKKELIKKTLNELVEFWISMHRQKEDVTNNITVQAVGSYIINNVSRLEH